MLARTSKAASRLSAQFRVREAEKKYVALVEGNPEFSGTTSGYLKKAVEGVAAADRDEAGAQYSELSWDTIARSARGTLLNVTLVTGRKHQIRHQFAAIGHPIVGDRRYGSKQSFHGRNIALHCYLLAVDHPTRAQRMRWTATPPDEWESDAESVRKWMDSRGYRPET